MTVHNRQEEHEKMGHETLPMMTYVIQVLTGTIGSIGFSILFNIKGYKIAVGAVGGAVSWIVYLISFYRTDDVVTSMLISTMVVAALAETCARICKTPVVILLVPMLIPLIPGRDLYYTMQHLVFGRMDRAAFYLQLVLKEAGAIAFGIILLTFVTQFLQKTVHYFENKKKIIKHKIN
ncbi:MAG: threonine/serine exporter family protein [Lachnospiraceae bacterium]|nr:threonine/serine exporter family protein [Lachnospiraceae bacterium]